MLLIGLGGGLAGGLLGLGGSVIMIPCMTLLFGPRQHLHQAAAMIVNIFVSTPAVFQHLRARAVMSRVVKEMLPAAVISVILGVLLSELPIFRGDGKVYLTGVFGLFLIVVTVGELRRLLGKSVAKRRNEGGEATAPVSRRAWIVGVPTGLIGGLLGVGGGIVAVPLQQRLVGLPLRNSIANSATMMVALSLVGAGFKNYALVTEHGYHLVHSCRLALMLIPGAVLGSLIGSRLTHVLPVRFVRGAFVIFLLMAAGRMLLYAIR